MIIRKDIKNTLWSILLCIILAMVLLSMALGVLTIYERIKKRPPVEYRYVEHEADREYIEKYHVAGSDDYIFVLHREYVLDAEFILDNRFMI